MRSIQSADSVDIAPRHCEMYRGFQIRVEGVPDDGRSVQFRRRITRRLGERYAVDYAHTEPVSHPACAAQEAFADAIRDAREAVDRLLGGWHDAHSVLPR